MLSVTVSVIFFYRKCIYVNKDIDFFKLSVYFVFSFTSLKNCEKTGCPATGKLVKPGIIRKFGNSGDIRESQKNYEIKIFGQNKV